MDQTRASSTPDPSAAPTARPARPPASRLPLIGAVLLVALAVAFAAHLFLAARHRAALERAAGGTVVPGGRPAPQYRLVNQLGQGVDSSAFAGKVQVVTFLFPYCTSYCPMIAANLVRFERTLQRNGLDGRVRIVAFNVDPAGSGPRQIRAFMQEYGWDPRDLRWQFLTGTPAQIMRVVQRGYMVDYWRVSDAEEEREAAKERAAGTYVAEPTVANAVAERAHVNYDIVHNDMLEIVGPDGTIRRLYDGAEKVSDAQLLAAVEAALP